jgi:hypothetical protein
LRGISGSIAVDFARDAAGRLQIESYVLARAAFVSMLTAGCAL